ncbi:zinc-binding dehydrogenase [Mucilaginibacter terrae]
MSRLIDEGKLTYQIAQVFPLEDVRQAHKLSKEGPLLRKVILKVKA